MGGPGRGGGGGARGLIGRVGLFKPWCGVTVSIVTFHPKSHRTANAAGVGCWRIEFGGRWTCHLFSLRYREGRRPALAMAAFCRAPLPFSTGSPSQSRRQVDHVCVTP